MFRPKGLPVSGSVVPFKILGVDILTRQAVPGPLGCSRFLSLLMAYFSCFKFVV